jgi:hypothetical protein
MEFGKINKTNASLSLPTRSRSSKGRLARAIRVQKPVSTGST